MSLVVCSMFLVSKLMDLWGVVCWMDVEPYTERIGSHDQLHDTDSIESDSTDQAGRKYPCLCYVWVGCSAFLLLGLTVSIIVLEVIYFTTEEIQGKIWEIPSNRDNVREYLPSPVLALPWKMGTPSSFWEFKRTPFPMIFSAILCLFCMKRRRNQSLNLPPFSAKQYFHKFYTLFAWKQGEIRA